MSITSGTDHIHQRTAEISRREQLVEHTPQPILFMAEFNRCTQGIAHYRAVDAATLF